MAGRGEGREQRLQAVLVGLSAQQQFGEKLEVEVEVEVEVGH
jgi:hypothetical protein